MASYSTTTMILLSVLFSGLLYANGRAVDLVSTLTQQSQFDFFTLALQWHATFCSTHENKCCPENGCCAGENSQSPPGFTIHGLWPDYKDGSWPSCCEGAAYDESKIAPLLDAMHKLFEQHGTCSTSVTGDQYGYFLTALELYLKYNVTEVLLQAKVKPSNSNTYPSAVLISAIENAFHAKPQLDCKNGDVIKEVRLCFTKNLQKAPPRLRIGCFLL
ncbi:putative ribonuclease T(2) [Helianthus annuus]|nr:putative ribonuclease T(2) [Helianthus annuus]